MQTQPLAAMSRLVNRLHHNAAMRVIRKPDVNEIGSKRIAYCSKCNRVQHRDYLPARCGYKHCNGVMYRLRSDGKRVINPASIVHKSINARAQGKLPLGVTCIGVNTIRPDAIVNAIPCLDTNRVLVADNIG